MSSAATSYWHATARRSPRPTLTGTARCDVAVLGGGIVGVTAAYLLARAGVDVVLAEARMVGSGTTGSTTAKLTAAQGLRYSSLERSHDEQTAAQFARMSLDAIELVDAIRKRERIDCHWRRADNFTYASGKDGVTSIHREHVAAGRTGLACDLADPRAVELPFEVEAILRTRSQAEFHPLEWLHGLTAAAESHGARIHEHSPATALEYGSPCRVRCGQGAVLEADNVIVATHYPVFDRGLWFARLTAQRSYCIAVRLDKPPPAGMCLSVDGPTRSLRSAGDDAAVLIVGGEGHPTGREQHTSARHGRLEQWTRAHFAVDEVVSRWSAQDPVGADGLPHVGPLVPGRDRALIATGFAKWRMTSGTAAASILSERILGREHPDADLVSANRPLPLPSGAVSLARMNAAVGAHLVGDRVATLLTGSDGELAPGTGAVLRHGLHAVAAYCDELGVRHDFSATCTHLGCELRFNDAERSWDCPCHGSRFDAIDGQVLEGPAVHGLEPAGSLSPRGSEPAAP